MSDDAEMSMMDDASNSSASLDTPAETQITSTGNPLTPTRAHPHFPSEPTPPHTGPEPQIPSLNANGKRALRGSDVDLASKGGLLGDLLNGAGSSAGPSARWADEDTMQEEEEDGGKAAEEVVAQWKSRKGQEEIKKAMAQLVDAEYMVKKRYGDVILDQTPSLSRSAAR